MSITAISRDWGVSPAIVRITDSAALATITVTGYIATQASAIEALNFGAFDWVDTDEILIYYADGQGFFTRDAATDSFIAQPASAGTLTDTLASGSIFVGSGANVATGVALTGPIAITNAGLTSIVDGSIVNADINASAAIDFSKLATLASGNLIVGSAGGVPTSVASSGDVTIIDSGATAIGANKVLSSMMSPLLLKYATVTMSAAQFNGAYAAPYLLLAAGGANTLIVLERAALVMTFVSAAFANGGVVGIQYDNTVHGGGVAASNTQAAADFFAAASTTFMMNGVAGNTVAIAPFTTSVNKGLYLSNLSGAFDTGDNTFVVHLWYRIIPTV